VRLLADENLPGDAVPALRAAGHDVVWIRTDGPGSTDQVILARAQREARILSTFDKDFGELAWRARLPAACGVVLLRLPMPSPEDVGRVIATVIDSRSDWAGHFTVVEDKRIRMRRLPPPESSSRLPRYGGPVRVARNGMRGRSARRPILDQDDSIECSGGSTGQCRWRRGYEAWSSNSGREVECARNGERVHQAIDPYAFCEVRS